MHQIDLFAGKASTAMHLPSKQIQAGSIPAARSKTGRGSRDTSRDGLAEHRATGKLGAQQQQVFAVLTRTGQAFTRAELAQRTGIRLSAICGRISELLALQVIKEGPRRQCGVTGKNAHTLESA